ncbi:MAG: TetR/AcrR family transcriptional regulator [Desulfotomaculaceae bacterium]|nr:TetR/AcrR family transcriptional regulator [Desulfotomaculaceae bacterium]
MAGTRQRNKMQTSIKKSWLLDKAGLLFWQKGYHATSMKDLAKVCSCKPANLYNYFKNKEDILYEVIRNITEQGVSSIRHLEKDEDTNPVDQLRSLIKSHFSLLATMKQSNILLSDTAIKYLSSEHRIEIIKLRDIYDSILCKIIQRGINDGCFAPIDVKVISYLIASLIIRSSIWFSNKGRLSVDEVGEMMFNFVYNGIRERQ